METFFLLAIVIFLVFFAISCICRFIMRPRQEGSSRDHQLNEGIHPHVLQNDYYPVYQSHPEVQNYPYSQPNQYNHPNPQQNIYYQPNPYLNSSQGNNS